MRDLSHLAPKHTDRLRQVETDLANARRVRKALLSPEFARITSALEEAVSSFPGSHWFFWSDTSLTLRMDTPAYTSENAPKLFALLENFQDLLGVEPSSVDYVDSGYREYFYPFKLRGVLFRFEIDAYLLPESDACQRKVVGFRPGSKVITIETEVPVYEFSC